MNSMMPSSVWTISVTSPQAAMSFMASMKALAGAKRRIAAGSASTTSRVVTPCSFATVSIDRARIGGERARQIRLRCCDLHQAALPWRSSVCLTSKPSNFGWPR